MTDQQLIHDAHQALLADERILVRLGELRGWTPDAIRRLGLGLHGNRILIPVLDADGQIAGLLRYQPDPDRRDEPKMLAAPGSRRDLFPPPETLDDAGTVWIVEGEADAIAAASIDLPAVGVPGAGGWSTDWATRFAGRDVVVCCDCDQPGRGLAARIADDLLDHATSIRIVDLAAARDDGYDLSDLVIQAGGEHDQARAILNRIADQAPVHIPEADRPPRPRLTVADWQRALLDHLDGKTSNTPAWPIPFARLREATDGGIRPGELWILAGYTSHGKALDVATPLATMTGWKTMGDVEVGDDVFAPDGTPTRVQWVGPIMTGRSCWQITFADGSTIVADEDHQWAVSTNSARIAARRIGAGQQQATAAEHGRIVTTRELAALTATEMRPVSIDCASPPQWPEADLPVDPYTLGAWLGDGCRRVGERSRPWIVHSLRDRLGRLGLPQNKHIPEQYLTASPSQRLALLQGLMDTDGTVHHQRSGRSIISLSDRRLADDVYQLVVSLGIKAARGVRRTSRHDSHSISFSTGLPVFSLQRKAALLPNPGQKMRSRYIRSVEQVESRPVRCISVAHESRLFCAGRELIPTHNSVYADMLLDEVAAAGARCHLYMTEMTVVQRGLRLIARRTGLSLSRLRRRELTAQQIELAKQEARRLPYAASVVTDWTPRQVVADIHASGTQLAVVDLLHGFHYRDERELSEIVELFAAGASTDAGGRAGGCAIVLVCHLNDTQMRDARSPRRPKPGMHSLKGATSIKQRADVVIFAWLLDDEDGLPAPDGLGEVWVAKNRNGGLDAQPVRLDPVSVIFEETDGISLELAT